MKVCPTNALQPTGLESGWEGLFAPRVVPRIGQCEYNCALCGEVCPTGAIRRLTEKEKHEVVIGKAQFDKNRCLPYARGEPCIVCEEHCPVPDKAIKIREVEVTNVRGEKVKIQEPHVEVELCVGCGICETKCPIHGAAGIRVHHPKSVALTKEMAW
jgi:formate hydrogenlyase subunit 6/NADH:ubiquinone oxidoreductase subunit I